MIQAPILAYPDFTLPFEIYVDASDEALGMVLGQVQNGREVVISVMKLCSLGCTPPAIRL